MSILPIAHNYKPPSRTTIFLGSRHYLGRVPSIISPVSRIGLAHDRSSLISVVEGIKSIVANVERLTVPSAIIGAALSTLQCKCSGAVLGAYSLIGSLFHAHHDCGRRVDELTAKLDQTQRALLASEAGHVQALQDNNQAHLKIVELEALLDDTSNKWMHEADRAHDAETKLDFAHATHDAYVAATKDKEDASAKEKEELKLALAQAREESQRLAIEKKILEKKNEDQAVEISRLERRNEEHKENDAKERAEMKVAYEQKLEAQRVESESATILMGKKHKKELGKKDDEIHEIRVQHAEEAEKQKEEDEKKKIETTKHWEAKLKASDDEGARQVKMVYALWEEREKELRKDAFRTTQDFEEHKKQVEKDSVATEKGWMLKMAEKDAEIKRGKETIAEMAQKPIPKEKEAEEAEKKPEAKEAELQQAKRRIEMLEKAAEATTYETRVLIDCVVAIGDKMEVILQENDNVVEDNDALAVRLQEANTQLKEQTTICRKVVKVANQQVAQLALAHGQIIVLSKEKGQLQWELTELGRVVAHQVGLDDHFDAPLEKLAAIARERFDNDRLVALAGGFFVPRDDSDMSDSESTLNASEANSQEGGKDWVEEQKDVFPDDDTQISPTYTIADEILEELDEYLLDMAEGPGSRGEAQDLSPGTDTVANIPKVSVDKSEAGGDALDGAKMATKQEPTTMKDIDRGMAAGAADGGVVAGDTMGAIIGDIDSLLMEIGGAGERHGG